MKSLTELRASLSSWINPNRGVPIALDTKYSKDTAKLIEDYEKEHFNDLVPEKKAFLQDAMLKRCVVALASYATLTNGFDTVIEPPLPFETEEEQKQFEAKYAAVKAYCDSANKRVNMEDITYSCCIKLALYGKAANEIVKEIKTQKVVELIKLPVYNNKTDGVQPKLAAKNKLKGYVLRVKDDKFLGPKKEINYTPEKVLYFVNNDVDGDWQGISDVQELIATCLNRAALERETPQILKRIHDPYVVASVDTSANDYQTGTAEDQKKRLQQHLQGLLDGIDSGGNVVTNNKVDAKFMQLTINLSHLVEFENKTEDKIIAHFGIPRFLVNRPNVNRATADTEFKAFVSGTVAAKQRYIKRVLERDWYDMLTRQFLGLTSDAPLPVKIKHVWRQSEVGDFKEKVDAAVALFDNGVGLLGDNPELALQLSGIYNDKVAEHFNKQKEALVVKTKQAQTQLAS